MTVPFREEDEELSGVVERMAAIDAASGAQRAGFPPAAGGPGSGEIDPGLRSLPLDDSDLGDDFADEKTPVMGVRVVVGQDGEVESVYAVDSELPPARVEAMSGPVLLPPPPEPPSFGVPPRSGKLPPPDSEPYNAIPLTRRRTGRSEPPPAPYAGRSTTHRFLPAVELWLPPLVAAVLASTTTAALMWLLGVG